MKKTFALILSLLMIFPTVSTYAATMYAPDGRCVEVSKESIDAWENVGWYREPVMKVYSADGKETVIYKSQYHAWNKVGWYEYPVINMYSPYGKAMVVAKSERKSWEAVGWYSYPVVSVYAPDGRTVTVCEEDYPQWKAVGWKRAPKADPKDVLYVGGKPYYLGMPRSELGTPDDRLDSIYGIKWYVFGADTYKNFFAAGVKNGAVVALVSSGKGFTYNGYKAGSTLNTSNAITKKLYTDKNDNGIVHTVFLNGTLNTNYYRVEVNSPEANLGESKLNFHLTNAFRVYHGRSILKWSDKAAESARLHSVDMLVNDYFSHISPNGEGPDARMKAQGIKNWSGENISYGRRDAVDVHNGWINSAGHRRNMLAKEHVYLGVGIANGTYMLYFTQNFHY